MTAVVAVAAVAMVVGAGAATAWTVRVRRRFVTVTVRGMSMSPSYVEGERVLVSRLDPRSIRTGQIVVLAKPGTEADWYIKRVAAVAGEQVPAAVREARGLPAAAVVGPGELAVLGEHRLSEDSRRWGCVPASRVLGVVVRKV